MYRWQSAEAALQPAKCFSATAAAASASALPSLGAAAPPLAPRCASPRPRCTSSVTNCCRDLLTRDSCASTSLRTSEVSRSESSLKRDSMESVFAEASLTQRVQSAAAFLQLASCSSTAALGASDAAGASREAPAEPRPCWTSSRTSCRRLSPIRASCASELRRSSLSSRFESTSRLDSTASALVEASAALRRELAASALALASPSSTAAAPAVGTSPDPRASERAACTDSRPLRTVSWTCCCSALSRRACWASQSRRTSSAAREEFSSAA
mmetsp:Transcript_34471/g.108243  ORF Transcript_34471/g.108243 Transcript_34471/m.108243 type:complete len:271 (+) Transcript_34471:458-1270(+)